MIDFENDTLLEGLNLSIKGKAKIKAKPKIAIKTKAKITAKPALRIAEKRTFTARPVIKTKPKPIAKKPLLPTTKAALPSIAAKLTSPAFKAASPAVKAQVSTMLAKSPALTAAVKASVTPANSKPEIRKSIATNLAVTAMTNMAQKPNRIKAAIKAVSPISPAVTAKAVEAIAPIAKACHCQTEPVLARVRAKLTKVGYPPNTIDGMLATLHDMNTALEKAALQRLATYEHNKLASKSAFEKEVLSQLRRLACNLPKCHPVRTKAHLTIMRKAGAL